MSNYSNQLEKIHISIDITDINSLLNGLYSIFENDNDFIENEEYFRKDTLQRGFDNEAQRIVLEYMSKNKISNLKQLTKAVEHLANLVFGNDTYYRDYTTSVLNIKDNLYSVSIAYVF